MNLTQKNGQAVISTVERHMRELDDEVSRITGSEVNVTIMIHPVNAHPDRAPELGRCVVLSTIRDDQVTQMLRETADAQDLGPCGLAAEVA